MLLPALARAKSAAKDANCLSNLKQLSISHSMYTSDFGRSFEYTANYNLWMAELFSYQAQVDKIRMCPVASTPSTRVVPTPGTYVYGAADMMWKWAPSTTNYQGSYGLNGWLYTGSYSVSDLLGLPDSYKFGSESTIATPANTPLFADEMWVDGWPVETQGPSKDLYNGNGDIDMGRYTIIRHGGLAPKQGPQNITTSSALVGATQMAFYDGHASVRKLTSFWMLNWHAGWTTPATIPAPR